jgi:hypothetical protein
VKLLPLLIVLAGCSAGTRSPVGAVRALAEAAQAGDRAEVWRLVGPATRAKLSEDAKKAGALAGRRPASPEQMLAVGWFSPKYQPDQVRELSRSGERAQVEVIGPKGEWQEVSCVRVDGQWKVELP